MDLDQGSNASIVYSLRSTYDDLFEIDPKLSYISGRIAERIRALTLVQRDRDRIQQNRELFYLGYTVSSR